MSADDAYLRGLVDGLGFICVGMDRSLNIVFWNRAATDWFGADAERHIGTAFLELLSPDDRQPARLLCEDVIATGETRDMEAKYPGTADGETTMVLILSPVKNDEGECFGVSASMRDISERKRMSRELATGRRIAALGRMAGGVAHHFNNILAGMLTSIDYVLASDSPRELRRTLRTLAQAISRATRITNQLAAFAESENQKVEWAALDVIVDEFLVKTQMKSALAGVQVVSDIEHVSSEPFEMQRLMPVLESVAQNAIESMSAGGELKINLSRDEDWAVIELSDTGCGISQDVLDRIFEPFFTTKGELGGGTGNNIGLGLAAVHGLVSEMGGTIRIASQITEGTKVTIRLPLHREAGK